MSAVLKMLLGFAVRVDHWVAALLAGPVDVEVEAEGAIESGVVNAAEDEVAEVPMLLAAFARLAQDLGPGTAGAEGRAAPND